MTQINSKTVHIIVNGKVQGVGFRAYTLRYANQYKITGWVKNLANGAVEIVASGDKNQLSKFIDVVQKSPSPFGKVNSVEINYIQNKSFFNFDVRY